MAHKLQLARVVHAVQAFFLVEMEPVVFMEVEQVPVGAGVEAAANRVLALAKRVAVAEAFVAAAAMGNTHPAVAAAVSSIQLMVYFGETMRKITASVMFTFCLFLFVQVATTVLFPLH